MSEVTVGRVGDVGQGEMKAVDVAGRSMILTLVGDEYRVFARECPHEWIDLIDGAIEEATIQCFEHGYEFDLISGKCVTPLTWCSDLRTLPADVVGDEIIVRV